ncbi:hypothetical protein ACFQ9V_05600, partial [Leifsonia sp. NPDC056665]
AKSSAASRDTSLERSTPTCPKSALDEHRSIERFHRTMSDGWAFNRHYNSESARARLPGVEKPRYQPGDRQQ